MKLFKSVSEKLIDILNGLEKRTSISNSAIVNLRGIIMASAIRKESDEKALGAMAATLYAVSNRVCETLDAGASDTIEIRGKNKTIFAVPLKDSILIALAPQNANIGLIQYELEKVVAEINKVIG